MTYQLLVRRRAKSDVRRAAHWYELQRPGLGREFVVEVDAALARLVENPFLHQVVYRDARQAIVHRFPYGLFYRIDTTAIVVFAAIHLHRDPLVWKSRLG